MLLAKHWIVLSFFVLLSSCGVSPSVSTANIDLAIQMKQVGSNQYTIFSQMEPQVEWTLTRPSKDDADVLLAVAGTYTSPKNTVEGYVILDGNIIQDAERQGWDGAALFQDGTITVWQTKNGTLLTREKMRSLAQKGTSLIQGHLLVFEGKAQHFKPQPLFPRRALVVMQGVDPMIIESQSALTLNEFAEDLAALGVRDALNLDMGSWSEGWYRDPKTGLPVTTGFPNENTARQTNWIIFRSFGL